MKQADLFTTVLQSLEQYPDLADCKPRVQRQLARQAARTVAGWWTTQYTPEYVAQHTDEVREQGVANLEPVLAVGFPPLLALLTSTALNALVRWIITAVIEWILQQRQPAVEAILQYRTEQHNLLLSADVLQDVTVTEQHE